MESSQKYTSPGGLRVQDLDKDLDQIWVDMATDPSLRQEVSKVGINIDDIRAAKRTDFITVEREGSGFDPVATTLIITFAPLVAEVAKDLWENVILPRIRRNRGVDALSPKR